MPGASSSEQSIGVNLATSAGTAVATAFVTSRAFSSTTRAAFSSSSRQQKSLPMASIFGYNAGVEEPKYTVVKKTEDYEVG